MQEMEMTKAQFSTECSRRRSEGLVLSGNTFAIKDQIKAAGGIWDGQQKAWLMPDAETMATMQAAMPGRQASTTYRPVQKSRGCHVCGRNHRFEPCGYPGCSAGYCDECDGGGQYCRG